MMSSPAREKSIEVTAEDAAALAAKAASSSSRSASASMSAGVANSYRSSTNSSGNGSVKKRISNLIKPMNLHLRPPKSHSSSTNSSNNTPHKSRSPSHNSTSTPVRFGSSDATTASDISSRPYYAPNLQQLMEANDNSSFNSESLGQMSIAPTVASLDTVKVSNRQAPSANPANPMSSLEEHDKKKTPWKKLKRFITNGSNSSSGKKHLANESSNPALTSSTINPESSPLAAATLTQQQRAYAKSDDFSNEGSSANKVISLVSASRRRIASMDFPKTRNKQQQEHEQLLKNQQQQQSMLDHAVRGRLDGMDFLSLGPVNLISLDRQHESGSTTPWEPAPGFSFAGQTTQYSTRQMVNDMIRRSTGQKAPEIVLEGFFRDDRWIVTLDNTPDPKRQKEPGSNMGKILSEIVNEHSNAQSSSNPESLPALQLIDGEDHSQQSTSHTSGGGPDEVPRHKLWGSMWGAENKPPPKPSHMTSVEDIEESDNILEMAASCSVPIDIDEDTFMISNALHLQAVHDLASVPLQHGRFEEAMDIFKKLLRGIEIQEDDGLRHLEGVTQHNMAVIAMWQDKYDEALEFVGKAIQARIQYLPEKHPDIAVSLVRQGYAYFALKRFNLAEASFQAALDTVTENSVVKAKVLCNLGVVRYQRGDDAGALKKFSDALEIQRLWLQGTVRREANVFGAAVILTNMGKVHIKRGDYDLAVSAYEEALLLQTSIFRSDHDIVLLSRVSLALAWAFNMQPKKAGQILNGVLRSQLSRFGTGSVEVIETTGTIGFLHFGLGNYEDALKCFTPVLKWQKNYLDADHATLRKTKDIMKRIKKSIKAVWV